MKRNIFAILVVFALILAACSAKPAATSNPTQPPQATATPQSTDSARPTATPESAEASESATKRPMLFVTSLKGKVEAREDENKAFAPVQVGQKVGEGADLRTSGDGMVVLYRDKVSMVVLDKSSEMRVKTLAFKASKPITILSLNSGSAAIEHKGKLLDGAVFALETPNNNKSGVVGSTIRVSYNPQTKILTAVCVTGECDLVKGDQKLNLTKGQAVDVQGLAPLPNMPEEMSSEQANQFLAMAHQMCGCELSLSEITDQGLETLVPPSDEIPTPEEDLAENANANGDTVDANGNTVNENGDTVDENGNIIVDPGEADETPTDTEEAPAATEDAPADTEVPPADAGIILISPTEIVWFYPLQQAS